MNRIRKWNPENTVEVGLSKEAAKERRNFYNMIEKELSSEGKYSDVVDLCSRAISITAKIALALHVFKFAASDQLSDQLPDISVETWLRAQALEESFLNTSIDMIRSRGPQSVNHLMHKADKWIKKLVQDLKEEPILFSAAQIRNRVRSLKSLETTQIENDILVPLEKLGRIRKTKKGTGKGGFFYEVNPRIIEAVDVND